MNLLVKSDAIASISSCRFFKLCCHGKSLCALCLFFSFILFAYPTIGKAIENENASSIGEKKETTQQTEAPTVHQLEKILEQEGIALPPPKPAIKLSGYVDASYDYNFFNAPAFGSLPRFASQTINGKPTFGPAVPVAPLRYADDGIPGGGFNLNQLKVVLERELSKENKLDGAFRFDLMLGQDAGLGVPDAVEGLGTANSTTFGLNTSTIFVEQAYVAFQIPAGENHRVEIHLGKFEAPIGFEVLERPGNLNFSYGLFFNNVEPFVLVGSQIYYVINSSWRVRGGLVDGGFNTSRGGYPYFGFLDNMVNQLPTYLVTFNLDYESANKKLLNTFALLYGFNGTNPPGFGTSPSAALAYPGAYANGDIIPGPYNNNGTYMELNDFGSWIPSFVPGDKLMFSFELVGGFYNHAVAPSGITALGLSQQQLLGIFPPFPFSLGYDGPTNWFGVGLYQVYKFNNYFSLNLREQYLQASWNSYLEGFIFPANIWETTLTLRFDIADNLMIRMEGRTDFGNHVLDYYQPNLLVNPQQIGLKGNGLVGSSSGPIVFGAIEVVFTY
ncbi:outer membrane beta-barrel protein [Methylacidiphilum kamchatkense]|uniref:outer membrane beta-barrel protein n=1 Tax=Methylacidiphilum kamchatkense TaxID=431057 RepID=UPI001F3089DA|nr:outer membrane beta-barrel protein [Methylacidiphilum kamchatkense]